jgi:diaphanous 1
MRPFFWSVVPPLDADQTIFKELNDKRAHVDMKELERLFCNAPAPRRAAGEGPAVSAAEAPASPESARRLSAQVRPAAIELLDGKRSSAVFIALPRFKTALKSHHGTIADALLAMDGSVFSEESLNALSNVAPTVLELDMIREQLTDSSLAELGAAEQFYASLIPVPFLQDRINLFLFKLRFDNQLRDVQKDLSAFEAATHALKHSEHIKALLENVLAIGNYMNGGSARGGAFGFKPDSLLKLREARSASDPSQTLLSFLLIHLKTSQPDLHRGLKEDLMQVHSADAAHTELAAVLTDVSKLQSASRKLRQTLDSIPESGRSRSCADKFFVVMSEFDAASRGQVEDVSERARKLEALSSELLVLFNQTAAKPSDPTPTIDGLIHLFSQFGEEYRTTETDLVQRAEQAERAKKREQEKVSAG